MMIAATMLFTAFCVPNIEQIYPLEFPQQPYRWLCSQPLGYITSKFCLPLLSILPIRPPQLKIVPFGKFEMYFPISSRLAHYLFSAAFKDLLQCFQTSYINSHCAKGKNFPDPETQIHLQWLKVLSLLIVTETNFLEFEHFSFKARLFQERIGISCLKEKEGNGN